MSDTNIDTQLDDILGDLLSKGEMYALSDLDEAKAQIEQLILEEKIDLISWCLSRTSMDELKRRWKELEDELAALQGQGEE